MLYFSPLKLLLHLTSLIKAGNDAAKVTNAIIEFIKSHDKTKLPAKEDLKGFLSETLEVVESNFLDLTDEQKATAQSVLVSIDGAIDALYLI